ncbi:hypothetical protein RHOSPDRAFT_35330 [Rhodotorula sp. JG-1b]|nr:hypothetical protein RHOSPDRAFT_35330 [Rhodotorula sp. JG-1b]
MRRSFIEAVKQDPNVDLSTIQSGASGFGIPDLKPFKVPTSTSGTRSRQLGGTRASTKRPRVVFTENDFYSNVGPDAEGEPAQKKSKKGSKQAKKDDDSDDDGAKKKRGFVDRYVAPPAPKLFPVYRPKAFDSIINKQFSLPGIKKKGVILEIKPTLRPLGTRQVGEILPAPLFDPLADHAIVLWDPTTDDIEAQRQLERLQREKQERDESEDAAASEWDRERKKVHKSLAEILGIVDRKKTAHLIKKVAVVIDPRLSSKLRPHQVSGVKFLYRATTGMIEENSFGCIMADEMGLGKTLQCITLLWTHLRQSPLPNKQLIDKVIVVCPASLVRNWANELVKWLGEGATNPLALDDKTNMADSVRQVRQWCSTKGKQVVTPILIASYERLRNLVAEIGETEVGLLLADEGHRLKNYKNDTYMTLHKINCKRRVILTGTPIQNDLKEYFSLLNFCNPGSLGNDTDFHKTYEMPILKGRDALATDKEKERGDAAMKELAGKVNKLIIRRTNDLLSKYLPVKYEHVVFCSISSFQLDLYKWFMASPEMKALLKGKDSQPLAVINTLRKVVNHPDLVEWGKEMPGSELCWPEGYDPRDRRARINPSLSGKMAVLDRFLTRMSAETDDKLVLISNFTSTLDLLAKLCDSKKLGWLRLDGSQAISKRQKLVDQFNDPTSGKVVFLLSSKAGGCGINLIGANRLVLFDPDWNPASDMQALARVWRDGQKKDCFVYRFVATGTVEEKIFQRQSHKQNLSSVVVDSKEDMERYFSGNDLRQLFSLNPSPCETHDLFKCKRCKDGRQVLKAPAMLYGDTSTWNHLRNEDLAKNHDLLLRAEHGIEGVTACFQYIST